MKNMVNFLLNFREIIMRIFTYLMSAGDSFKIGKSKDPVGRRKGIQTSNQNEVRLLAMWDPQDGGPSEQETLAIFGNSIMRGEWIKAEKSTISKFLNSIPGVVTESFSEAVLSSSISNPKFQ